MNTDCYCLELPMYSVITTSANNLKKTFIFQKDTSSDGSKNVRSSMFDRLKPNIGCSSSITIR